jgi:hypothetical protein
MIAAHDIARQLAARIVALAADLLPNGHREGAEWRCGSVAGEAGFSLGVHLRGDKAGVWSDFATGEGGDALALVRAVLGLGLPDAMIWSRRWLGIDRQGEARKRRGSALRRRDARRPPSRSLSDVADKVRHDPDPDPGRWCGPWQQGLPIAGTPAETYLAGRGLGFDDPLGDILRFHPRRARRNAADQLEYHPAMLALLHDIVSGQPVGIINIFLRPNGGDRLRDRKAKTVTGRARAAAVMLSAFDGPTEGLTICEGIETGIGLLLDGCAPVWACGSSGTLASFPVLGGIECLTIAADGDAAGFKAAQAVARRWREADRDAVISAPATGDWADVARRRAA